MYSLESLQERSKGFGNRFELLHNTGMLSVLDEAILMSTHNVKFHDKIKIP